MQCAIQGDLYGPRRAMSQRLESCRWWAMPSEAAEALAALSV
jgi:hypothetical protein